MKIGFVVPWFGIDIQGGAEAECRELALHLNQTDTVVEILTTCIKSFNSNWNENYFSPGVYTESGLLVRRFKADERDVKKFDAVNYKLMHNLMPLSDDEETIFVNEMVNSSDLYEFMRQEKDGFDLFLFIPYMFGTTYFGCQIAPEKSILIPCFHDESYFYLRRFKNVFEKVAGIVYNASPEKRLVERNYCLPSEMKQIVMGIGMDTDKVGDKERFRNKFNIKQEFILYAGRKDAGKNVDILLRYFSEYKRRNDSKIQLVLIGGGHIQIPSNIEGDVIDLGFVETQDKYDAYHASTILCQPSHNESFSYVIMESWLAEKPVLVSEECDVTANFVKEAQGGLWFRDYYDFEGCVNYFLNNNREAKRMGQNGRKYVTENFSWDTIIQKYIKYMTEICESNVNI